MATREHLRNYLLHTLTLNVLPEILPLTDIDAERPFSNSTVTDLLLDAVIEEFKYTIQDHYDYLLQPGAKQRLLSAFSFFYNHHISPDSSDWITPLYRRFLERFRQHPNESKLNISYLHHKNAVFLGFDLLTAREETLIKQCILQTSSSSIQIPFTSSMYTFMQRMMLQIPEHSLFPPTHSQEKHTISMTSYDNEEDEIEELLNLCKTKAHPITVLCPNDTFRSSFLKKSQKHQINVKIQPHRTALSSSLFQFLAYTLSLLKTDLSVYSLKTFFSHPISHSFIHNDETQSLRSDIMVYLLRHFEKYGKQEWKQAFESMTSDFNRYLNDTVTDDTHFFKKELPSFIHALNSLKQIETALHSARNASSPTEFKTALHHFLSLFIPHQLADDDTYSLLTDWLLLETCLTNFSDIYTQIIAPSEFDYTKYIKSLHQHISHLSLPTTPSLESINVQLWNTLPLRTHQTVIIAGFTHKSWTSNSIENDCVPLALRPRFHAITTPDDGDLLFYLHRYCSLNTTIITSSQKNKDGYLLPHRFLSNLEHTFTILQLPKSEDIKSSELQHKKTKYIQHTKADTLFTSEKAKHILKEKVATTTFSSSQLETYQNCPYAYFLTYISGHISPKQVQEGLSSTEWGSLLHTMLFKSYSALLKTGMPAPDTPDFKDTIINTSLKHFEAITQDSLYWDVKKDLCFGTEDTVGILDELIKNEISNNYTLKPTHLEQLITTPISLSGTRTVHIKGILDCILESSSEVAVLDYKSGKNLPSYTDISTFRSLQLSIYMLLLKQKFQHKQVCGGIYFHIHHQHHEKKVMITTAEAKKDIFGVSRQRPFIVTAEHWEGLLSRLEVISTLIENGVFTTEPIEELDAMTSKRPSVCMNCSYKPYCRYQNRYSSWG